MALDLVDLQVFLAACEHGSFSRAAATLHTTQPSVSERIGQLERGVGQLLFTRHARGVELTRAGERLLPYAQRCIALAGEAEDAVRSSSEVPRLRIAVHTTFAHRAVPIVLDALEGVECRILVRDAHSEQIQEMLVDGAADVGFVLPAARPRELTEIALREDRVVCALDPTHALARRGPISIAELARFRLAVNLWGEGSHEFLDALRVAGAPEENVGLLSDARTATLLALDHAYVAIVTESSVQREVRHGDLVIRKIRSHDWTVPLACTYRTRDAADPLITCITRAVRATTRLRRT
jgi:DNA-binding transcriptional LysR family regulator